MAFADIVTISLTTAPFSGNVTDTSGAEVSPLLSLQELKKIIDKKVKTLIICKYCIVQYYKNEFLISLPFIIFFEVLINYHK